MWEIPASSTSKQLNFNQYKLPTSKRSFLFIFVLQSLLEGSNAVYSTLLLCKLVVAASKPLDVSLN